MARRGALWIAIVALFAMIWVPPGEAAGLRGSFNVKCPYSHSRPDDPIVFPGTSGVSHLHDFFANKTTQSSSTYSSMIAGSTTCRVLDDKAGYWAPAAYLNGVQIRPKNMHPYYFGFKGKTVETIPPDLQMVAGLSTAASSAENPHASWFCGNNSSPVASHPYDCTPYQGLRGVDGVVGRVDFPSCWDGTAPARPRDLAYASARGACPGGFPHLLPFVRFRLHLGIMNPCAGATPCTPTEAPDSNIKLTLSSGPYYTLHADFWNTWVQARLDNLVASCLNRHVNCGEIAA
jgi:Domain of unknown function (DUF1996)